MTTTELKLNHYQKDIVEVTGCPPEDAAQIEDYMRHIIFHSTLDWQTKRQFNTAARTAWKEIQWSRTPEGVAYREKLQQARGV